MLVTIAGTDYISNPLWLVHAESKGQIKEKIIMVCFLKLIVLVPMFAFFALLGYAALTILHHLTYFDVLGMIAGAFWLAYWITDITYEVTGRK